MPPCGTPVLAEAMANGSASGGSTVGGYPPRQVVGTRSRTARHPATGRSPGAALAAAEIPVAEEEQDCDVPTASRSSFLPPRCWRRIHPGRQAPWIRRRGVLQLPQIPAEPPSMGIRQQHPAHARNPTSRPRPQPAPSPPPSGTEDLRIAPEPRPRGLTSAMTDASVSTPRHAAGHNSAYARSRDGGTAGRRAVRRLESGCHTPSGVEQLDRSEGWPAPTSPVVWPVAIRRGRS
jgi:hypothetical protein